MTIYDVKNWDKPGWPSRKADAAMTPAEIKAIRERARLTQAELADLLRISDRRTVRRWETGDVPVSGPASIILELMAADELPNRFYR